MEPLLAVDALDVCIHDYGDSDRARDILQPVRHDLDPFLYRNGGRYYGDAVAGYWVDGAGVPVERIGS